MRRTFQLLGLLMLIGTALPAAGPPKAEPSKAQSPKAEPSKAAAPKAEPSVAETTKRPQFRPAVLASGPTSLINRINVDELIRAGQKQGAVQFGAGVGTSGEVTEAWTYRAMPGSEALDREVLKQLGDSKFTPAIYNHQPVPVLLYGTVIFNPDEKPRLHIFLNQDPEELKAGSDFIGPQPVFGADSQFSGLHLPEEIPVAVEGVVELRLQVDEKGNLQDFQITGEDPPLLGFRISAMKDFNGAKFIPAFRDGDPASANCILSVCYKPVGVEVGQDQ